MATELSHTTVADLLTVAREAQRQAYAPYSDFNAGAAVLSEDGRMFPGALVENMVFGLAMCAERVALFQTVAQGGGRPVAVALAAPTTAGRVTFPCGACLQVGAELGGMDLSVVTASLDGGSPDVRSLRELAPGLPHRRTLLT